MNGYNEIDDFVVANNIVRAKYGSNACLEEFQREYKKKKKVLTEKRYRFVNVLPIARYPSYGFKSVLSAMNALTAHETGLVSHHRYVKYTRPAGAFHLLRLRPPGAPDPRYTYDANGNQLTYTNNLGGGYQQRF